MCYVRACGLHSSRPRPNAFCKRFSFTFIIVFAFMAAWAIYRSPIYILPWLTLAISAVPFLKISARYLTNCQSVRQAATRTKSSKEVLRPTSNTVRVGSGKRTRGNADGSMTVAEGCDTVARLNSCSPPKSTTNYRS